MSTHRLLFSNEIFWRDEVDVLNGMQCIHIRPQIESLWCPPTVKSSARGKNPDAAEILQGLNQQVLNAFFDTDVSLQD